MVFDVIKKVVSSSVLIFIIFALAGCGSGSGSTSGSLVLADIAGSQTSAGVYTISETKATYTSDSGSALPGTKIDYEITISGSANTSSGSLYSDSTGSVVIEPFTVVQDSVPIYITIKVQTGGLTAKKIFTVPALTTT